MSDAFRVGLTGDFLKSDGTLAFEDIGTSLLDAAPEVTWDFLKLKQHTPALDPEQVLGYDAVLVLGARVTAETVAHAERLAIVARFGVGYDSVDVDACTRAGVALTITPDGVRRPVASSVIAYVLALSLRMLDKDHLIRAGRWADRQDAMGVGLIGRTLGVIGMGNIGREIFTLARPFGMCHLVFDPYVTPEQAAEVGAVSTDLDTLLETSDFVSVNCPLNGETHHLLDARRLRQMRSTAYLINTARGPIVDQAALTEVLREGRIAGAALDVFEQEPIDPHDPILSLDNVILAPHAICWTDQCFRENGLSACRSILEVAAGRPPRYVVNREVLDSKRFRDKLARLSARAAS
ncbi:MAG: dehydrogenase [Chloroflexi bacterium]|nr:dehydrogenase [Chloroflexota bacterium]